MNVNPIEVKITVLSRKILDQLRTVRYRDISFNSPIVGKVRGDQINRLGYWWLVQLESEVVLVQVNFPTWEESIAPNIIID